MKKKGVIIALLVVCLLATACGGKKKTSAFMDSVTNEAKKALENGVGKTVKNISRAENEGISYYSLNTTNLGGMSYEDIYGSFFKEGGNIRQYYLGDLDNDSSVKELLLRCEDKDGYLFETCFCVMNNYDANGKEDSYIVQLRGQVELKSLNCKTYYSGSELFYHDVDVAEGGQGILIYAYPDIAYAIFDVQDTGIDSHDYVNQYIGSYKEITYKDVSDLSALSEVVGRK